MRRLAAILALILCASLASAQSMRVLLDANITTAVTGLTGEMIPLGTDYVTGRYVAVQADFTYGSGGTTAKAYIQTTLDGGLKWCDVMAFAFATTTATKVSAVSTNVALSPASTCTDGSLTDNTILNGLIGNIWRVKYTTVGTYAAGTRLKITAVPR